MPTASRTRERVVQLNVNGSEVEVADRHEKTPLLWVLRDVLGESGVKFGCGGGFCAACTVLVDGTATKACQTAAGRVSGAHIVTADLEPVGGEEVLAAVRAAWQSCDVVQCGYCQPGQIMAAVSLLTSNPHPDDAAIDKSMNANLCRCGTYPRIRQAIHQASSLLETGEPIPPVTARPTADPSVFDVGDPISAYVVIGPDGAVSIACSQVEMGQGVHTAVATIVADELDADPDTVRVVAVGDGSGRYDNVALGGGIQQTGGSTSTVVLWARYRQAAAAARARLVVAAAGEWSVDPADVTIANSVLSHPDGHTATFADVAAVAAKVAVPDEVRPKSTDQRTLVGTGIRPRVDGGAKVLAQAAYTIDVDWPEVKTAIVSHPPRFGGRVAGFDASAAKDIAGVVDVVQIDAGVAVIGETFADALAGSRALVVQWDDADAETRSSNDLRSLHRDLAERGDATAVAASSGDVLAALGTAAHEVDRIIDVPYLVHAPMEPNNAAIRRLPDGLLQVRCGTQSPDFARFAVADITGAPFEQIDVETAYPGGGFGLRVGSHAGPVAEVAQVGKAIDFRYPVKVQSTRAEEFRAGHLRPLAAVRVRLGADANGMLQALDHRVVTQTATGDMPPPAAAAVFHDGIDFLQLHGALEQPYRVANHRVEMTEVQTKIRTSTWRAIGTVHNTFALETAVDEVAAALDIDPVEFRLRNIEDPRTAAVLRLAADKAEWNTPLPAGRARGVAVSNAFGTHSAQVIEVSTDDRGRIRIDRVVFACDPGIAVTPDLIVAQIQGGVVFGLSAALWGRITINNGAVDQQNFDGYPLLRMAGTPAIEVHIVESDSAPGGMGEVAVSTVAPAVVNAIAALTGRRLDTLPVNATLPVSPNAGRSVDAAPIAPVADTQTPVAQTTIINQTKENTMSNTEITALENGPYQVTCPVVLRDAHGRALEVAAGDAVYLCRCGGSANKPYCDGTHATIDFDGTLAN